MITLSKVTALALLALGVVACDEGVIPQAPPKDAGDDGTTGTSPAVVRTVETRNPFGDTAAASSLMVDGDFELTGRSEQMPWIAFDNNGQATLNYATGGQCRSGVRCAVITPASQIVGYFASPKTDAMNGSIWVRPDSGNCNDVQVGALDLDSQQDFTATFGVASQDGNGWCNLTAHIPNMANQQPVLYVALASGTARIDDAVVLPAASTSSFTKNDRKMPTRDVERARFIRDWVRGHRRFDAPASAHTKP
ncbi:MAG TPA: hypothetical protein VF407_17150 [Polyangiaceae bacterium]